jgi:septum formation protein
VRHGVEERLEAGETPEGHARRLALAKGRDAARSLAGAEPGVLLAADTVVVLQGTILGKPEDAEQAEHMLCRLRGRTHQVVTAVCLIRTDDGRECVDHETTSVVFREFDDATLRAYVESREPMDKAGAYGIQGLGAFLSERITGSWSNVVGLPLERLPDCLEKIGVDPLGLFRGRLTSR